MTDLNNFLLDSIWYFFAELFVLALYITAKINIALPSTIQHTTIQQ